MTHIHGIESAKSGLSPPAATFLFTILFREDKLIHRSLEKISGQTDLFDNLHDDRLQGFVEMHNDCRNKNIPTPAESLEFFSSPFGAFDL